MGVNKVVINTAEGEQTLIDLTNDNATAALVFEGATFHGADGEAKTGTFTLDPELDEQGSLIEQIMTDLEGKAAGGSEVTDPVIEPLTVTENGTYTAPNGVNGYSPVTVNVESSGNNADALLTNTLTEINSNVTNVVAYTCRAHSALVSVNLPEATSIGTYAFHTCTGMTSFNAPKVTSLGTYSLYGCSKLTEVNFPVAATIPSNAFYQCTKLKKADFGVASSIATYGFFYCSALEALILRKSDAIVTLSKTDAFTSSSVAKGTGYIYVPAALIDTYKAATNWSTYAAQFRAIEDYPDVCGG